jgi:hypothetical protein
MCRSLLPLADDISRSSSLRGRETRRHSPNIVLCGKSRSSGSPLSSSPGSFVRYGRRYRPCGDPSSARRRAGKHVLLRMGADFAPCRIPRASKPPSGARIPFAYRPYREEITFPREISDLAISSCLGTLTVFAGKACRSVRVLTSSCRGRYIVRPGKVYRPAGENLSSSSGNIQQFFLQIFAFTSTRYQEFCICLC